MSVVTAVETTALSFSYLRGTLAESTYWQAMQLAPEATYEQLKAIVDDGTRIDATTKANGLAKIIGDTLAELSADDVCDGDVSLALPRIICRYSPDFRIELTTTTSSNVTASFDISVELAVPPAYRRRTAECLLNQTLDQYNKIGALLRQWKAAVLSGSAGMLRIDSWQVSGMGLVLPEQAGEEADGWMRTADIMATFQGICS